MHSEHNEGDRISMQNTTEGQIRSELLSEIQRLEENYKVIKDYLSGAEYEPSEIHIALQKFKDNLSVASAHILTLYNLRGQKIRNIPWEPLFTNIDYALATIAISPNSKARSAVHLALTISEPKIDQVMSYLSNLKESLV
jgi:hypothetical protein